MSYAATKCDALRLELAGAEVHSLTAVGTLPGVAITAVAGRNAPGVGSIAYDYSRGVLHFKAPGSSTWGPEQVVADHAALLLHDGGDANKWIRCTTYTDYMPSSDAAARVFMQDVFENAISNDDVTAAEALAGNVADYTVEVHNDGAWHFSNCRCWLDATVTGIQISLDNATWVTPTSETHADVLMLDNIAPGASDTVYLRRTIAASATSDPEVLNILHFTFNSL